MIVPTGLTTYIFDNEDILLELDGSNNITARYTHGPGIDEPLVMEKGGSSFFYHADGLGSITEITNVSGTVVQAYTYSSFGKIESQLDPNFVQPYTYTSREFDPETGLYFYRARQYDPSAGRFLQEDPLNLASVKLPMQVHQFPRLRHPRVLILNPGNLHLYGYSTNNPITSGDPWGLVNWGGIFGQAADAIGFAVDTSGTYGYYGGAIGGAAGATFGFGLFGLPGAFAGGIIGGIAGNLIGGLFDSECAGQLNCRETLATASPLPPSPPPSPPRPPTTPPTSTICP